MVWCEFYSASPDWIYISVFEITPDTIILPFTRIIRFF